MQTAQIRSPKLLADGAGHSGEDSVGCLPLIDRDGRWTIKRGCKRDAPPDRTERRVVPEIAVPMFGYKNHVGIDREYGLVRRYAVTHAVAHAARLGVIHL